MEHKYSIQLTWKGNKGTGTQSYTSYDRIYAISAQGKEDIQGSSDPNYKGDASKWNPEELLLSSLSACHMLWYLHLCANKKIVITEYRDDPIGFLAVEKSGEGRFQKVTLQPTIIITDAQKIEEAQKIHDEAHHKCFIAQSVNFPVEIAPKISV